MVTPDVAIKAPCPRGCGATFGASWCWDYSSDYGTRMTDVKVEQTCSCDVDQDEHLSAAYDVHAKQQYALARRGIY